MTHCRLYLEKNKYQKSNHNVMAEITKIIKQLQSEQDTLKTQYGVKRLGVFGSYVRNEQKKNSDVDVLVEFSKPLGLFKFIELENHLSKKLGLKVDLVMKSALKPYIGKVILKEVHYI